jgi:hypothetical protein
MSKIELKQKQAIRTICRVGYREHTAPLFRNLQILPLDKLVTFNRVKFMHSFINKTLPLSFSDTWIMNRDRNQNMAFRNMDDLYVPPHRIELVKKLPICSFPSAWNSEPDVKHNLVKHQFSKQLKIHLSNQIV